MTEYLLEEEGCVTEKKRGDFNETMCNSIQTKLNKLN